MDYPTIMDDVRKLIDEREERRKKEIEAYYKKRREELKREPPLKPGVYVREVGRCQSVYLVFNDTNGSVSCIDLGAMNYLNRDWLAGVPPDNAMKRVCAFEDIK